MQMTADNRKRGNLPLRETHPQLFKAMILKVMVLFAVGLAILVKPGWIIDSKLNDGDSVIPLAFWGLLFIAISIVFAYGITNGIKRYKWARRALIAGSIVTGIWAVGYFFALFSGQTDRVFATIFWFYACINFIIWAGEPAFNPISSALQNNGKAGKPEDVK